MLPCRVDHGRPQPFLPAAALPPRARDGYTPNLPPSSFPPPVYPPAHAGAPSATRSPAIAARSQAPSLMPSRPDHCNLEWQQLRTAIGPALAGLAPRRPRARAARDGAFPPSVGPTPKAHAEIRGLSAPGRQIRETTSDRHHHQQQHFRFTYADNVFYMPLRR